MLVYCSFVGWLIGLPLLGGLVILMDWSTLSMYWFFSCRSNLVCLYISMYLYCSKLHEQSIYWNKLGASILASFSFSVHLQYADADECYTSRHIAWTLLDGKRLVFSVSWSSIIYPCVCLDLFCVFYILFINREQKLFKSYDLITKSFVSAESRFWLLTGTILWELSRSKDLHGGNQLNLISTILKVSL